MIDEDYSRMCQECKKYPLLTKAEEQKISKVITSKKSTGLEKDDAIKMLINHNIRLVLNIANKYYYLRYTANLTLMDLVQSGFIGLSQAAAMFDYKRNVRFSTYAYLAVVRHIMAAIDKDRMISLPGDANITLRKYYKLSRDNFLKNPKFSKKSIEQISRAFKTLSVSINEESSSPKRNAGDGKYCLLDVLCNSNLIDEVDRNDMRRYLYDSIKLIKDDKLKNVIKMYLAEDSTSDAIKKIAKHYKFSTQMSRVYIRKSVKQLRRYMKE
jgi:RNA polymerase primary sigma factor